MSETKTSTDDLKKVFQLIEKGKGKEADGDLWAAVDDYAQAQTLLTKLSDIAKTEPGNDEEKTKIAQLYQRQSREYLHRARKCFLHALQSENEQDERYREAGNEEPLDNHPPKFLSITQEEAEKRVQNFVVLFSKDVERVISKEDGGMEVEQQQYSLEERLMELNKSIPHGFKTSAERIIEINQGLRRLGLTLYTEESRSEVSIQPPKSDHEQIAEIIAQAKDEVKFNVDAGVPEVLKAQNETDDDNDDDETDDKDDEEEEESESDENDILRHRKAIRKQVVEAQIELANLVALLDKEPIPLDQAKAENEVDLMRGKKSLADAKRYLGKALKLWDEES